MAILQIESLGVFNYMLKGVEGNGDEITFYKQGDEVPINLDTIQDTDLETCFKLNEVEARAFNLKRRKHDSNL